MMMITTVDMVAMVDTVAMEEEDTDGAFCSFSVLCERTWFELFHPPRNFLFCLSLFSLTFLLSPTMPALFALLCLYS